MRAAVLPALIVLLMFDAAAAFAHRLNIFAYTEGATIVGSAYFSGGGEPADAAVTVYDAAGAVLGRTTTDEAGAFTFDATVRADHRITVETADGHAAEFVVTATELPAALPPGESGASAPVAMADQSSPDEVDQATLVQPPVAGDAALEAMVSRIVQQQLRPLRQQLVAYDEEVRVRDIIAGIGYILGIFGLSAYAMALRRRSTAQSGPAAERTAAE